MKKIFSPNVQTIGLLFILITGMRLIVQSALPWWSFAVPVACLGLVIRLMHWKVAAFFAGFVAGFLIWVAASCYYGAIFSNIAFNKIGQLLSVPGTIVILISGVIGGLTTGLSLQVGYSLLAPVKGKASANSYKKILERIIINNSKIRKQEIKRVLILNMEKVTHIGDFCITSGRLKYFKSFYNNAVIDVCFTNTGGAEIYNSLLKNNPYLNRVFSVEINEIDFLQYDILFCIAYDEGAIASFLQKKYRAALSKPDFHLAVFSISQFNLMRRDTCNYMLPVALEVCKTIVIEQSELYVSEEEVKWGNEWLQANGVVEGEELIILLDSTSRLDKLMREEVYFDYVRWLLARDNIKVLIFDENNIGKETLYKGRLEGAAIEKMIFSKGLKIREALCILSSKYTKLVFGPCTGLMHCAASIYNQFIHAGTLHGKPPLLITYTGKYPAGETANIWWGNYPLVNCLLLKNNNGSVELHELKYLTDEQKNLNDSLPCSEYTAPMLIEYTAGLLTIDPSGFSRG